MTELDSWHAQVSEDIIEPERPILKLFLERSVCAPQSLSAGTFTSPIVSFSMR